MGESDEDLVLRNEYATHLGGPDGYYQEFGNQYRNPHEDGVAAMVARMPTMVPDLDLQHATVLDLACGSGEVTIGLLAHGLLIDQITACDPYTGEAFAARMGRSCEPWSFADIANGALDGQRFDLIVSAYALHLCEPSWLPSVCMALAQVSDRLVIITPHKRPELQSTWGWALHEEYRDPAYRIRMRAYESGSIFVGR